MGVGQTSVAAATAVVGYDLVNGTNWQQMGTRRALSGIGMTGSAAAGDTKVDVFIDQHKVGEYYNTTTGFPTMDHVFPIGNLFIPPHSQLHVYVTDAPATNPINLVVKWVDF